MISRMDTEQVPFDDQLRPTGNRPPCLTVAQQHDIDFQPAAIADLRRSQRI